MNLSQPKTILVAEDHADARAGVRLFLEKRGFNVVEAVDGREAIEKAHLVQPDLILMNLNMPHINGIDATFLIRQSHRLAHVPILATSGEGEYGIQLFLKIDKLGKGFIGYITKPISFDELLLQIKEIFEKGL